MAGRRIRVISLSASEYDKAGPALPPSVRKDVALRLLDSVEVLDQDSVDEAWTAEINSRIDDVLDGKVEAVPHEAVLAQLAERRALRHGARQS